MPASIEVFQDLTIASSTSQMAALEQSLIARAKAPWRHRAEEVSEPQEHGTVLFMEREEDAALKLSAKLSRQWQSLDEWFSPSTAQALRRFSNSANKSTGASHPRDQERWMEFLISAHHDGSDIDSDLLYRWLHEVEGWQEDGARDLLMDYDFARTLLGHYDQHR